MLLLIPGDHGYFTWEESAFLGPRPTLSSYVASHVTSRGDVITVQDSHTGSARGKWEKWEVLGKNLARTCSFRRKCWEEMGENVGRAQADCRQQVEPGTETTEFQADGPSVGRKRTSDVFVLRFICLPPQRNPGRDFLAKPWCALRSVSHNQWSMDRRLPADEISVLQEKRNDCFRIMTAVNRQVTS